jgi:hypothetical protein
MLRYRDSIRLSAVDQRLFEALTGPGQPAPTTVADYNQRLRQAARSWRRAWRPEERELADIATGLLIDEADTSSVIDRGMLAGSSGSEEPGSPQGAWLNSRAAAARP